MQLYKKVMMSCGKESGFTKEGEVGGGILFCTLRVPISSSSRGRMVYGGGFQ